MDDILKRVLKEIKPSAKEEKELKEKVDVFLKRLNMRIDAEAMVGGSFAKKSYLRDIKDIDVFVMFDKGSTKISEELGAVLKKMYPDVKTLHGSRDYFQLDDKGLKFEIVPIIRIKKAEEAENITDISPLHVRWVTKQKVDPDEIRLTKAFAKAARVYGAESYIQGFSGYTLEILTIHHGGFMDLLKKAAIWKERTVIDPEGYHKDVLFELNASKINSPLILIDPVEKGRNTAASLSQDRYDRFRQAAKAYLRKPSEEFFRIKAISREDIQKKAKGNDLIMVEGLSHDGKDDVEGCRLLKVHEFFQNALHKHEFTIRASDWDWDKKRALFWYILEPKERSQFTTRTGPPLKKKEDAARFREKYKKVSERNGRLYAQVKREYLDAKALAEDIIVEIYIKERLKKPRLIL